MQTIYDPLGVRHELHCPVHRVLYRASRLDAVCPMCLLADEPHRSNRGRRKDPRVRERNEEILRLLDSGVGVPAVAKQYGLHRDTIWGLKRRMREE